MTSVDSLSRPVMTSAESGIRPAITSVDSVSLEVDDPAAARAFYNAAFGLGGSHRIIIGSDADPFTGPDGFVWETA